MKKRLSSRSWWLWLPGGVLIASVTFWLVKRADSSFQLLPDIAYAAGITGVAFSAVILGALLRDFEYQGVVTDVTEEQQEVGPFLATVADSEEDLQPIVFQRVHFSDGRNFLVRQHFFSRNTLSVTDSVRITWRGRITEPSNGAEFSNWNVT